MDIIWNLTQICPWDCRFCCVSAISVKDKTKKFVYLKQIQTERQLNFANKLKVLKILTDRNCSIDFSGGDPLYFNDDFKIVQQATRWLLPEKISVSMTGCKITKAKVELLKKVVVVEFTLDNMPEIQNTFRPKGFNVASMDAMKKLVCAGIKKITAVTVLYSATMSKTNLVGIYQWFCDNKIHQWDILKFYPVGRATKWIDFSPSDLEYLETMNFLRKLRGFTKIHFQHSLELLESKLKCPAGIESFGILPDGTVTACAWALNNHCRPLKKFNLGKLPEGNLDDMLKTAHETIYSQKTNFCRIAKCRKKDKSWR